MRPARFTSTLVLAGLLAFAAGCGDGDAAPADADTPEPAAAGDLTVVASEFAFDPADIEVPADQDVALTLENVGVVEHDLTIDELGIEIYADTSETVTETVNIPAGTYEVYCSIPGHQASGMEGTLTAS